MPNLQSFYSGFTSIQTVPDTLATVEKENITRADLHIHTDFSDGLHDPRQVVQAASVAHIPIIAVTDHDTLEGALRARSYAINRPSLGVEVIPGEEISTVNGHVIGLFIQKFIPPRLSARRTVELIHQQGGLAILPHPFHLYVGRDRRFPKAVELINEIPFDGVEAINHGDALSFATNWKAEKMAQTRYLAAIGSSDAHDSHFIGMACTEFLGTNAEDLRKAILNRKTKAIALRPWRPKDVLRQLKGAGKVLDRYSSTAAIF